MSILVQLLKNTQAWALALLLTFTATSKAELLFTYDGTAITITGSNPKASGVLKGLPETCHFEKCHSKTPAKPALNF